MNGKQKYKQNVWYVLSKIDEQLPYTKDNKTIPFGLYEEIGNDILSYDKEISILKYIQSIGVIKIHLYQLTFDDYKNAKMRANSIRFPSGLPFFEHIEVIQPAFRKLFSEYEQMDISISAKNISSGHKKIRLTLERDGKLSHFDREEWHTFKPGTKLKVLNKLAENRHIDTALFAVDIAKKATYVRKEIGRLKKDISKYFNGFDGDDFIPESEGNGYYLGKNITIRIK